MRARPSSVTALASAVTVAVALAGLVACAAPSDQAAPLSTRATVTSAASSSPPSGGPVITVPGLSSAAPTTPPATKTKAPASSSTPPPVQAAPTTTSSPDPAPTSEPATTSQPEPAPAPRRTTAAAPRPGPGPAAIGPVAGRVVVIDPGHNGANGAHPDIINALVDAGFGQTKPCNTTGTSTNDGYPEHALNWKVAGHLQAMLEAKGIRVVMTRDSDDGVGPCVNQRAAIGNAARADAVVSIHGDGDDASAHGFYVMTAEQDPAGATMASRSQNLAVDVRDGLVAAGLSPSDHLGSDGLWPRNDLAGLNLSVMPTVMIESGNMRNSADAALMSSAAGQQEIAQGLANGVLAYLGGG